ncbi:hypothetical protein AAMO2058_001426000, partial [Amorphochlora amoebiformis]
AFASILTVVIKIGEALSDKEYKDLVLPAVIKLFACNERQVRVHLLKHLKEYARHLPDRVVNDHILPNVSTGFTDANSLLRELTLKSLIHLAPKLPPATMEGQVLRHLSKLQSDIEPGIRTNTIYCTAKICSRFGDSTRRKILFRTFSKGLKDTFAPARLASIASFQACIIHFTPEDVARRILPAISVLAIDTSEQVRKACISAINVMSKFLQHASDRKAAQARSDESKSAKGGSITGIGNSGAVTTDDKTNSGSYGGAMLSTVASWAQTGLTAAVTYAKQKSNASTGNSISPTQTPKPKSALAESPISQARGGGDDNMDDGPIQQLSLGRKKEKKPRKQRDRKLRKPRPKVKSRPKPSNKPKDTIDPFAMTSGGDGGPLDLSAMLSEEPSRNESGEADNSNTLDDMISSLRGNDEKKSTQRTSANPTSKSLGLDDNTPMGSGDGWGGGDFADLLEEGPEEKKAKPSGGSSGGGVMNMEGDDWNDFMNDALGE